MEGRRPTERPADVERFLEWLNDNEFSPEGSPDHRSAFGSLVRFQRDDGFAVDVVCDRSQWQLVLHPPGGGAYDPLAVDAARAGRALESRWTGLEPAESMPSQLPTGMSWHQRVPELIEWLSETPDARDQIRRVVTERTGAERRIRRRQQR